jgi:cyclic pyranopterin phosphate synthase
MRIPRFPLLQNAPDIDNVSMPSKLLTSKEDIRESHPHKLEDRFGRIATYLRVSVTDRCNLYCTYCVPSEDIKLFPKPDLLTFGEIERTVRILVALGIRKLRITGGEPLLRKQLPDLIERLAGIESLEGISMTTNATKLAPIATALADAGLDSVNISLDSIDPVRFAQVTQGAQLTPVLQGIDAALQVGLRVKLNAVALADLTKEEAISLIQYGIDRDITIRFIEWMPLCGTSWDREQYVPLTHLETALHQHFQLEHVPEASDVAREYAIRGTRSRVGFITSLSRSFCSTCNRLRLSATGQLRSCLFSQSGENLRPLLREGASDSEIRATALRTVAAKPRAHGSDDGFPGIEHDFPEPIIRSIGG